ncbi:AmpG family muropeptide MFS transporter [Pleionea litopenaei]|uniref:MFS transporter n=1 Tax=Pleionea litopenaei TaxID=3070815 RepID=A0AA51X6K0_9GAMM|nr:MFS transporter [Pleionea sp. HL-JVS1]WMS86934.1 MFS transporter [Pleionea sp. HL-JVS1]
MSSTTTQKSWLGTLKAFRHPQVVTMLFLGLSAGLPLALIFSSLSLWLSEAGIEKSTVTYFSWGALAYSFKFLWAPLVDRIPLPWLTLRLGRRRGWLLLSQLAVLSAIALMGSFNPGSGTQALTSLAIATVLLGFSSATQDVIIDAYRIEIASTDLQALLSSTYIAGYRGGMLLSGAGALLLAESLGSTSQSYSYEAWRLTYYIMASLMLVGITTTLIAKEPELQRQKYTAFTQHQYLRFFIVFMLCAATFISFCVFTADQFSLLKAELFLMTDNSALSGAITELCRIPSAALATLLVGLFLDRLGFVERDLARQSYLIPVLDFFQRYGVKLALLLLLFIGFYRISDIVLGVIANVFYHDMGFSKQEIAEVSKTFGLIMMILGGFLGGLLSLRFGVLRILLLGAILTVATNLLFVALAQAGHNLTLFYIVISADNLTAGLASAAFVAFLASITNVSFTAIQYAIFSSLMSFLPKVIGGYSGAMVTNMGYENFFILASAMGVPVIFLIFLLRKRLEINEQN